MGYELLVLVMKFGLNCEVLEFLWKINMIMKTWLIDDMNPCLICFNWSFYLCYLLMKFVQRLWVNWDQKREFRVFWCEFSIGKPFSGFHVLAELVGRASLCRVEECRTAHTVLCVSGLWVCFRTSLGVPSMMFWCCFD